MSAPDRGFVSIRLQWALGLLVLVALLVPLIFVAIAVERAGESDRRAAEEGLLNTARILAGMFESTLDGNAAMVRVLAHGSGGGERYAEALIEFSARLSDVPVAIADGRLWAVSNLSETADGSHQLELSVRTGGGEIVTLATDPISLAKRLDIASRYPETTLVAVVDGNGRILARSVDQEKFIGRKVPSWDNLQAIGADDGVFEAQLLDGGQVTFGFARLAGTPGWAAVIGEPRAVFDARWREPVTMLVIGGIAAVIAALVIAFWVAREISRPVAELVRHARAVVSGEVADEPAPTMISEFETLRRTQLATQATLMERLEFERRQAMELAISKARYRAMAQAGVLATVHFAADGHVADVEGWEQLTGQPPARLAEGEWLEVVHPEDRDLLRAAMAGPFSDNESSDVEIRVRLADGRWLWTRLRLVWVVAESGGEGELLGTIEDIDARRQRDERLSHLALHDALTGLPNRTVLRDRVGTAMAEVRDGRIGALLFIDLDLFKQANDSHGHAVGDAVLTMVGSRLRGLLRQSDIAGRLGGDEFAMVLANVGSPDAVSLVARRVVRAMSRPFEVEGTMVRIGASVGVAIIDMPEGDVDALFAAADRALYAAKQGGRSNYVVDGGPDERISILAG